MIRSLGGSRLTKGVGVDAEGALGGLITLWDEDSFQVEDCIMNNRCIIVAGVLLKLNKCIVLCNVHASSLENERKDLWEFILLSMNSLCDPRCVGGDFNSVLVPAERGGVGCNRGSMRNFNTFVLKANVVNTPLHGTVFTWSNNRVNQAWAKLDCFLMPPEILMWFPNLIQRGLPRYLSDHNPMKISKEVVDWGPKPFRFFNWWLEEKDMMKDSIQGWKDCMVRGSKGFVLFSKAKAAILTLRRCLNSSKPYVLKPKEVEGKLAILDAKVECDGWSEALRQDSEAS